jgi:hypothetical protein
LWFVVGYTITCNIFCGGIEGVLCYAGEEPCTSCMQHSMQICSCWHGVWRKYHNMLISLLTLNCKVSFCIMTWCVSNYLNKCMLSSYLYPGCVVECMLLQLFGAEVCCRYGILSSRILCYCCWKDEVAVIKCNMVNCILFFILCIVCSPTLLPPVVYPGRSWLEYREGIKVHVPGLSNVYVSWGDWEFEGKVGSRRWWGGGKVFVCTFMRGRFLKLGQICDYWYLQTNISLICRFRMLILYTWKHSNAVQRWLFFSMWSTSIFFLNFITCYVLYQVHREEQKWLVKCTLRYGKNSFIT